MIDPKVIRKLHAQLNSGEDDAQLESASHIRNLSRESEEYRLAFAEVGAVGPLVGLLDNSLKQITITSAEALTQLAASPSLRTSIREAGGLANLVGVLQVGLETLESRPELVEAVLHALLALCADEEGRVGVHEASGISSIMRLLEVQNLLEDLRNLTAHLVLRLAYTAVNKNAIRECNGIKTILKLIGDKSCPRSLSGLLTQTITVLAVGNEINQDNVRENFGIPLLVHILEERPYDGTTASAADALRAISMNNDENKNRVREAWAIPLLVQLLGSDAADADVLEKTVDCLRILTTGNDSNKVALFTIPAGVPSLVRLLSTANPDQVVTERAAAVIGNLSTSRDYFSSIRESGALQKLVALLDAGSTSRVTEIAAKTLANLSIDDNSRKGIRLAGGVPPLMRLLLEKPSEQVLIAAEEALRRLEVDNMERNATLDAFRYFEQRRADGESSQVSPAAAEEQAASSSEPIDSRPLTRYSLEDTCGLLQDMGFHDTSLFVQHSVTGADLLDLSEAEMQSHLQLSPLQVRKLQGLVKAHRIFNAMMATPGKGEITALELEEYLRKQQLSKSDVRSLISGLAEALQTQELAMISFGKFARGFQCASSVSAEKTSHSQHFQGAPLLTSISRHHAQGQGREDVKKDHPDWGVAQIGKELGAQWKAATEDSKKKHFAQAEKDKERYTKEMQAYQGKE
ncbi:hypothetical protein WJX84_012086 [Apatococcus fuscideae]|uniref:HMG box domain-containing protein n=1 Tax=Apatococcus fuscideae TaxID=2026836 RepID=A0AAW1T3K3_9CHLO